MLLNKSEYFIQKIFEHIAPKPQYHSGNPFYLVNLSGLANFLTFPNIPSILYIYASVTEW